MLLAIIARLSERRIDAGNAQGKTWQSTGQRYNQALGAAIYLKVIVQNPV
jgi:hypothetical protein